MLFIQKDMQKNGVVYPGFENLATPQTKTGNPKQIFENSSTANDMTGITVEQGATETIKEPEKEITTDENGNEVAVVKNGDEIVEATVTKTDSNGNKIETVVSYENGKPVKQINKKNGNVSSVSKFTHITPTDEKSIPFVIVETIDAGENKIVTTALETDKYGNIDQEDFVIRKTFSKDGTETTVVIGSEYIQEEKLKFDGKKVTTLYNGTNLADFDNHKLHRIAQETDIDGVKRYAEYDSKGNTKTTVQFGETPSKIAKKFNIKEQALRRLNPQKGKNAITQVGADILIPGEFNADSYPMRVRKSKAESVNKYKQFETRRLTKEINSGEVQNIKLAKSYNNVYEFAKDKLLKSGVKNPDNNQINEEANKLILLNGEKFSYKVGKTVKVAKSLTASKPAQELTKYGFKASAENRIFFKKFNALNPQQKQNVLSAIQYCKSQKITNPSDIKAKVLETLGINLFNSNKTVPMVADNNYGVMAYQRNSKPISIETFVKDHLKLDIKSELGKTVLERLSQVDQDQLNKISAKNFKGFNNKTLDGVASMLETVGVQIRTQAEINVKNNTPRAKAEKAKRAVRIAAAENIALAYDNAINVIKNYQGNQGWINVGFYREKLGQLLDKVNPTDVATCFDAVIKRLEKEKQYAVSRLKTASANESEFRQAFKDLTGKDYNENSVKNFIAQAQKGGDWTKAYDKAFGDRVVKRATDKVNFQQYVDGAGDIVLMLLGTEAIGKGVAWAGSKVATKLAPYVPKVLSKIGAATVMKIGGNAVTVSRVAGSMATSAATFTTWDASKNYINLKTKDIQYTGEDAVKEWQAYKEGNVESGKFGAFAGLLNSTVVGKVVSGTMKMFEKPVAKAVQGVTKTLEKGETVTGAEVMKTFIAKQAPGMVAKTAGTVAEVAGFTMYETANNLTKKLLQTDANGQLHLPKDLTEEGLTQYLLKNIPEEFLKQAKGIGEIKAISKLIFMHKGAIAERERMMNENLSKCEMLSNVKVQKAEIGGVEIYAITTPNGNRKIARSPEDVVAYCNILMQMDMAMNSKTAATEANPNAPKGMNVEENALLEKATKENPAEVVTEKVKKQWQQTDLKKEATEEKVDLFNLDTNAGLNEPAPEVKDEVTSLIFTGKLKDSLTQHYNELGNVFKDIAKNRSADFKKLVKECGSDKEAFCKGVISILSEEIGMKGFEPKIEMKNLTGEADGQADWTKGTIYINSTENNVKKLVGLISHEYVHMLQYRDILAQYGETGLREVIMNDNNIPQEKKESQLSEILKSSYTKKLLDNYDNLKHSPENSLNEYITRIYKDEFSNGIDPNKDMKGYTNQGIEREAYHLGSGKLGNNTTQLEGLTLEKEESMKDVLARMRAKLKTGQTSQDIKDNTSPKKAENFVVNEDGSITRIDNTQKGVIQSDRNISNKVKDYILSNLSKRYKNKTPEELEFLISNIASGTNDDINIITKRLNIINEANPRYLQDFLNKNMGNAGFILDNYKTIYDKIILNDNFQDLGPDKFNFVKFITSDNLQKIIDTIDKPEFPNLVKSTIYDSKNHNVELGNETVKINSALLVHLLTGQQYSSETEFNKAVNGLTEANHRIESDNICPYNQIAEGILTQKPELAQIAKEFQKHISKGGNADKFFKELEKSGRLPHEIELKTIVPDKNALVVPSDLLDVFIDRTNQATEKDAHNLRNKKLGNNTIDNIPKGIVQSEITSENFEQQKADFIKDVNEKLGEYAKYCVKGIENTSTPEDLAAVKEFWKWANTEEGQKLFKDTDFDVIGKINAKNIADFKDLAETINSQKDLSDDIKFDLLYGAIAAESLKETKEFIQGIEPSDLAKLNELEDVDRMMLSGSSTEQKAKLDFYKEIKTGKYNNIIKDDNIFKHVFLTVDKNFAKTKALYDTFAEGNISKEYFEKIVNGLETSDIEAIKQLYSQVKDLLDNNSDMSWIMFRNLKQEDIPAKIEIINTLKSAKATNEEICEILNKTNKDNLDIAKDLVQKAFANGDEKAEKYNVVIILNKLTKGVYSKEFVEKNTEALLHLDGTCIRKTTETNLELASKISENKEISSYQVDMMLNYATDKEKTQKLIHDLDCGITELPELEVMNQLKMDFIEIIKKHLSQEELQEIEKAIEDKEEFESILLGKAYSRTLRDVELSPAEENIVNNIIRICNPKGFTTPLRAAKLGLESYFNRRNQYISDMNWALESDLYKDKETKQQTLDKFNELYPLFDNEELAILKDIYLNFPEKERLNIDYSLIAKRKLLPLLRSVEIYDYNYSVTKISEFLNCDDAEFQRKKQNLTTRRPELQQALHIQDWKRILNMPEAEFNRLKTPLEERTETPVDIKAYEAQMRERMADRITYDPIEAAELIERAAENQSIRNEVFGNHYKPDKINAFEKLPKKAPVAVIPLPAAGELMRELRNTGHVKLSIPNEGGVKVKPYDAVIHPEDNYRLNVTEDAGMKIRYGTKLQWSNFKIARDLLQNYYDGHGHTLEGVNIEVNKTEDGKYKIKISGESSWDYSHLDQMGSSTKHDPLDAGGYGEGTRAVAVSLLSKPDITNVKYASGDWTMTYGRSSDDLKSAYMTQTLSKNSEKVKGSTVEFETENADIAHKLLEAKDYFYQPHNPDFKNLDFENEFFGFKLKDDGAEGNLYLIQRYETNGEANNGLQGATIVFKTQPNHPTLVEKDGGQEFKLGTGVDRAQIPSYDINRILSRYVRTMTDEELTQAISSMEKNWGEGGTAKDTNNNMYEPFVTEAHRRGLGIDFKDSHYVYLNDPSPASVDMAKNLGYKIANTQMKNVGMQSFDAKDTSKMPHQPTEEQSKEIRLLEEGVRVLQECTDMSTKDLLLKDEVTKPTYMFSEGDHGAGAEAIIEGTIYQGHWMRDSKLLLQNYVDNLATFLHEISHKAGGDDSEVFSVQLTKLQSHITNVLMHSPNAFKKIQTLSKMFEEARYQESKGKIKPQKIIQDNTFTPEQYKQHIDNLLSVAPEYREYVEPEASKEPDPIEYTGDGNRIVSTGNSVEFGKTMKFKSFEENRKLTSRFNIAGIKRFAKSFINKILGRNRSKIEEDGGIILGNDDFASFTIDEGVAHFDKPIAKAQKPAKEEKCYKYEEFIPSKHESYTTLKSSDSMMKELEEKGSVELSIPNAGGLNPKISEIPRVEDDPAFNKTVPAKMTISYAEKRDWSNEKIARDLMQNFYDGNGHTLEGVDLKVTQNDNGTYTIRIDGKGIYNYEHLKRLGGSDKDDPRDAGGFGEGSRIIAGSLLAKGTARVRFACQNWQMDFTKAENNRTNEECVMSTLTKSESPLEGNYIEFDTNDKELVKKIMDSKNYFYSPYNPDFRDLDIENEFFGFKVTPNKNGNLYYIQRFQTPDKKMDNGLEDMTLVFKQAAFGENFRNKGGYTIDLNTTRDRMAIEPEQMTELTRAYAKTLSDADLVKAIAALEPILTSNDCKSDKFGYEYKKKLSYKFAQSIIQEAISRGIKLDFDNKNIVYVRENTDWDPNLTSKEEEFFKKGGYIFANTGTEIGIEDAKSLYAKLHRPHSIKPTTQQAKQLQILNEAVKLITENDQFGLFPKEGTQLYAFDKTSNIESSTGYYAAVNSKKLNGVFINTKKLQSESFPTMLTNVLCEMLEGQTSKKLSSYSYNQTDLIRSQLNTLITQPQIVEKLNILERIFKEQQK